MSSDEPTRIEMQVTRLGVDTSSGNTVIVLEGDSQTLAMSIGLAEAISIQKALDQSESSPRPLTHDLLRAVIDAVDATVQEVEVIDLRDGIYFAEVVLVDTSGQVRRIDSRPSDAIALALRVAAPIFVHAHVVGKEAPQAKELPSPTDKEGWKKFLEEMDPKDFGKYKM